MTREQKAGELEKRFHREVRTTLAVFVFTVIILMMLTIAACLVVAKESA